MSSLSGGQGHLPAQDDPPGKWSNCLVKDSISVFATHMKGPSYDGILILRSWHSTWAGRLNPLDVAQDTSMVCLFQYTIPI